MTQKRKRFLKGSIIFTLITALVIFLLPSAILAEQRTLDVFNSEGIPELSGKLTADGSNLFLEVSADPMAISGNNAYMSVLFYTGNAAPSGFAGPWDNTYLSFKR